MKYKPLGSSRTGSEAAKISTPKIGTTNPVVIMEIRIIAVVSYRREPMWKHKYAKQIYLIGCPGFILMAAACCLTTFAFINGRALSSLIWLLAAVGVILLVWFGVASRQQQVRVGRYQAKRDATAKAIREAVLAGEKIERQYFVYLRPFDIDNKFYAAPGGIPADHAYVEEYGWPTADHDLESALANLVYAYGLLVAVSDKPGDAGAAHVKAAAETWREDVRAICTQAAGIFMVPFDSDGTAWEVNLLVDAGWLDKTFFVMPAEQGFARGLGIKRLTIDYRTMWAAGRTRYQALALPAYEKQGQIFQRMGGEIRSYLFGSSLSMPPGLDAHGRGDITPLRARLEELAE
jgi:hypothetical protein